MIEIYREGKTPGSVLRGLVYAQVLIIPLSGDSTWILHLETRPIWERLCDNGINPTKDPNRASLNALC
jgi:hypothetical protein